MKRVSWGAAIWGITLGIAGSLASIQPALATDAPAPDRDPSRPLGETQPLTPGSIDPVVSASPTQTNPAADAVAPASNPDLEPLPLVSDLSDISPNHWAYKAVKNLMERYGLMTGYPNRTFRGNQSIDRFEFAAVLSRLFDEIERLKPTDSDDLNSLRRLQQFYKEALADLDTRTQTIGQEVETLDRQQVSTTTKLHIHSDQILMDGSRAKTTLVSRTRLSLNTSFSGNDLLVTQLEFGNDGRDAITLNQENKGNALSTFGRLVDGGGLDAVGVNNPGRLRKLYYQFQPIEHLTVAVGSAIPPSEFIDRNSFANNSGQNFASSFFANNPLIVQNAIERNSGAGVVVNWQPNDRTTIRGLFAGADAGQPSQGLFHDRYQGTIEAEYQFQPPITVRFQYTNANVNGSAINAFGLNTEWAITRQAAVFGRFGLATYRGFNTELGQDFKADPKTWAIGATLRNFLIPGSKAGIAIGQPFITSKLGNRTQTNFEAYFGLLLNDHINLSPSLLVLTNPDNRKGSTVWQWALRVILDF